VALGASRIPEGPREAGSHVPCETSCTRPTQNLTKRQGREYVSSIVGFTECSPVMYPRTIASSGITCTSFTRMDRPSSCSLCCCTSSGMSSMREAMT
jgi:hypothetical protein